MSHDHTELPATLVSHTGPSLLTEIMRTLAIPTRQHSHAIRRGFGPITAIAVSRDQTRLALCSGHTAWLLDVETGTILMALEHPGHVTSASFSTNVTQLATGCEDAVARIWDLAAGTVVQSLTHPDTVHDVHLHPKGEHLATGCQDGMARIFELSLGTVIQSCRTPHQTPVRKVLLDKDMRWLYAKGRGSLDLWGALTGAHLITLLPSNSLVLRGSSTQCRPFAHGFDKTLAQIWDSDSGELLRNFEHPKTVTAIWLTTLGTRLATACRDGIARIWEVESDTLLNEYRGHIDAVTDVVLSDDCAQLFTGSEDGTAKRWDAHTGDCIRNYSGHTSPVICIALSTDGTCLFVGGHDPTVTLYDLATGRRLQRFTGHTGAVSDLALSPDGSRLATASHDGTARVWDVASGRCLLRIAGHALALHAIRFMAQGRTVLTGGRDREVKFWDAQTGALLRTFTGYSDRIRCFTVNRDETVLVIGGDQGLLSIWDLSTGTCKRGVQVQNHVIHAVSLASDAALFTSHSNGVAKRWDQRTGRCTTVYEGHRGGIRGLCLSPDGTRLATGGYDHVVKLWDVESGACLRTFAGGHTDLVRSVAFTPDTTRLITAGKDGRICIWEVASGELLAMLHNLNEGFLWTTPPDSLAPHGWVWTDREDLLIVSEEDADGGNAQVLDENNSKRLDYLATQNNQRRVMRRIRLRGEEDRNRMTELLGLHGAIRQSEAEVKRLTHME